MAAARLAAPHRLAQIISEAEEIAKILTVIVKKSRPAGTSKRRWK
jgi:hypothetical protein